MKLANVEARDICFTVEFTSKQILCLHKVLQLADIKYDGENAEEQIAVEYLNSVLFPSLEKLCKDIRNGEFS